MGRLVPGKAALVWRDKGEDRICLHVNMCLGCQEARLLFEFPVLASRGDLPWVDALGKLGLEVSAQP